MTTENETIIDEQDDITTYSKGRDLEVAFSKYMKDELQWTKVRVGVHLTGKFNMKGTTVDIVGERVSEKGKTLKTIAIFYGIIFALLLFIGIESNNDFVLIISLIFEFTGIIAFIIGIANSKEYCLVECKNLKSNVTITQIRKTLEELNDYKASNDKRFRFTRHYFVSGKGYVENALRFALEHNIVCFQKQDNSFKKVEYWNK